MKNSLAEKIKSKLWQRIIAQFLFCAIIFTSGAKKAFGLTANTGGGGYVTPTLADTVTPLANFLLTIAYSLGIILYLLYFYFYSGSDDKNTKIRNKRIKTITIILASITFLYISTLIIIKEIVLF
jgi:hypothetical protein